MNQSQDPSLDANAGLPAPTLAFFPLNHTELCRNEIRTKHTYISNLILTTLPSMCRTQMSGAIKADLRYHLGNTDSINRSPVHPVSVLHLYFMSFWVCQNILHILFPHEHLCESREVDRNQKKKEREKNPIKEIQRKGITHERVRKKIRNWQYSFAAMLQRSAPAEACSMSDIPHLPLGLRPRPPQWQFHPHISPQSFFKHSTEERDRSEIET